MLKLEDIEKDAQIRGIQADEIVRVVQVEPVGDNALTVYYKDNQSRRVDQASCEAMIDTKGKQKP